MRWTDEQLAEYQGRRNNPVFDTPVKLKDDNPLEDVDHMAVAQYLNRLNLFWLHIPNGGKRSKVAGARLKAMGMKKGASDFLIFDAPPLTPCAKGVAMELKRAKGGKVSDEQLDWLENMERRGWIAKVCHGANDALEFMQGLGWRV